MESRSKPHEWGNRGSDGCKEEANFSNIVRLQQSLIGLTIIIKCLVRPAHATQLATSTTNSSILCPTVSLLWLNTGYFLSLRPVPLMLPLTKSGMHS